MNFLPQTKLDIIIYLALFLVLLNILFVFSNYYKNRLTGTSFFEAIHHCLAKGDYKKALAICKKLHKKRPHDPNVLLMTAVTYFRAGKKQESKKIFEKLVLKDPSFKTEADKYLNTLNDKT
ncbi:tetratricopeptide repeat protein [Leucothrix arctica]|uniref:tetratricopeptide repeat protein n=1 Tax=Leucothrix arctica TaxID=1481894 RepID=UPI001304A518|nr:tetratricopeptide repeat protein [Leucothrix arctica]